MFPCKRRAGGASEDITRSVPPVSLLASSRALAAHVKLKTLERAARYVRACFTPRPRSVVA